MYLIQNAFKNLLRHKKRYITTGVLLLAAFSVVTCAVFHYYTLGRIDKAYFNEYMPWVSIRFRNDLQYDKTNPNIDSESLQGEFDHETMAEYNHPYPLTKEAFEKLAQSELVEDFEFAYMEAAYQNAANEMYEALYAMMTEGLSQEEIEEYEKESEDDRYLYTEFYVCGGEPKAFVKTQNIPSYNTTGTYRFRLVNGEMYGKGECIVSQTYAQYNNVSVGDTLELYDLSGENVVFSAEISGIYVLESAWNYPNGQFRVVIEYGKDLLLTPGTPYDRSVGSFNRKIYGDHPPKVRRESVKNIVFTDFDTAYCLYGDEETDPYFAERHHFNKYLAWYRLKSYDDFEEFTTFFQSTGLNSEYDGEFETYNAERIYEQYSHNYVSHKEDSVLYIKYVSLIGMFILLLAVLINIRERGREIGVMVSLGIPLRNIALTMGLECAVITGIAAVVSGGTAYFIHKLTESQHIGVKSFALPYELTPLWGVVIATSALLAFVMGWGITMLYMKLQKPAKLVKTE